MELHREADWSQAHPVGPHFLCNVRESLSIRPTGLLCFTDEKKNDILLEKTINAFKANPGSDYELYYGEDFKRKFPYLKMGDDGYITHDNIDSVRRKIDLQIELRPDPDLLNNKSLYLILATAVSTPRAGSSWPTRLSGRSRTWR